MKKINTKINKNPNKEEVFQLNNRNRFLLKNQKKIISKYKQRQIPLKIGIKTMLQFNISCNLMNYKNHQI